MLIFALLTLAGMAVAAIVCFRSSIHPSVVFCGSWALSLALIACSGDLFYPIRALTLLFILSGASVFCLFSWGASIFPAKGSAKPFNVETTNRILTALVWLVVVSTPFYFRWLVNSVNGVGGSSPFLMAARLLQMQNLGTSELRLAGALIEIAQIVAVLCLWHKEGHPKRVVVAILFAYALSLSFGQKAAPFILTMELLCVDYLQNRRMRKKLVFSLVLCMVVIAGAFEYYVHLGGKDFQISNVSRMLGLYMGGGIAGLDQVIKDPSAVPPINPIYVMGLRAAKRFGAHIEIPEVAGFVNVGPYQLSGNVYTIFWPYLNFGYLGSILFVGILGAVATRVYKRALNGGQPWVILYAKMFFAVAFSTFTEYFISSLYIYGIMLLAVWIVYFAPVRVDQFLHFCSSTVGADLQQKGIDLPLAPIRPRRPSYARVAWRNFTQSIRSSVVDELRRHRFR